MRVGCLFNNVLLWKARAALAYASSCASHRGAERGSGSGRINILSCENHDARRTELLTCWSCITHPQPKRRFLVTPARAIAHTFHNTYPADILNTHTGRMTRAILPKDDPHTSPAICNAEK
jgi:hypothetical protein